MNLPAPDPESGLHIRCFHFGFLQDIVLFWFNGVEPSELETDTLKICGRGPEEEGPQGAFWILLFLSLYLGEGLFPFHAVPQAWRGQGKGATLENQ